METAMNLTDRPDTLKELFVKSRELTREVRQLKPGTLEFNDKLKELNTVNKQIKEFDEAIRRARRAVATLNAPIDVRMFKPLLATGIVTLIMTFVFIIVTVDIKAESVVTGILATLTAIQLLFYYLGYICRR